MRRFALLLLVLALPAAALADEITLTYRFAAPTLVEREAGSVEPVIAGLPQHLVPGEPIVPVKTAWIAIPQGHEVVGVRVDAAKSLTVAAGVAAWAPHFQPWSDQRDYAPALPNAEIYDGVAPFPATRFRVMSTQYKRGVAIAPIALHPVQFLPGEERLVFAPALTVRVTTRPRAERPADVLPYRGLAVDRREIARRVDNPELLASYEPEIEAERAAVDYLVIAPTKFHQHLQEFIDHKTALFGLTCELASYEDILATGEGFDDAAKVRNYIRARYEDGVQWVLIVGDADSGSEVVKLRKLYVTGTDPDDGSTYTDRAMASEQYYGCLDGSYNGNDNNRWGEPNDGNGGGEVDLLYDVHVGRFAVEEPWELKIIAAKTIAFEDDVQMPWRLLFVGETADEVSEGGDMKDEVYKYCGDQTIPVRTLYDRDGTLSHQALVNAINNNNMQWLNHMGHANATYVMGFTPGMVGELTNTRMYLGLSQGCYSGSVDGIDVGGYPVSVDCMAEQFTSKYAGGAFAFFMNTRYGFYLRGRVDGPSNVYDWELADSFFNEGVPNIGAAMDKAKEDCLGTLSPHNMMRWAWYTLFLFGDPQTPMRLNCDNDGDGFVSAYCKGGNDCDDQNPDAHPGVAEVCDDGVDNNCDGLTDAEDPVCAPPSDDDAADDDAADDDAVDDDAADDDAADEDAAGDDDGHSGGGGC